MYTEFLNSTNMIVIDKDRGPKAHEQNYKYKFLYYDDEIPDLWPTVHKQIDHFLK